MTNIKRSIDFPNNAIGNKKVVNSPRLKVDGRYCNLHAKSTDSGAEVPAPNTDKGELY